MGFYILLLINCIILCVLSENKLIYFYGIKISKRLQVVRCKLPFFYIYLGLLIVTLSSIRADSIGKDIYYYKLHFYNYLNDSIRIYEPGYTVMQKVSQYISNNFRFLMILCSLFTLIPIFFVIKKEIRRNLWISITIIIVSVFIQSFSILRGYLGVSFIFLAYTSIKVIDNKLYFNMWFWIYIAIAISFHYSMLLFLAFFYLGKRKNKPLFYYLCLLIVTLFVLPGIPRNVTTIIAYIRPRYTVYITDQNYNISFVYVIIFGLITLLCYHYRNILYSFNPKNMLLSNLMFYTFCFSLAGSWFPAYSRVLGSILPFTALIVPEIIRCEKNKNYRVLLKMLFFSMFLLYWSINIGPNSYYRL